MLGKSKHTQAEGPQLRILAAALEGFRFVARNPVTMLGLVLPAALCLTAVHFALFGFMPPPEDDVLATLPADIGEVVVEILLVAIMLVAWQRRILLGRGMGRIGLTKRELRTAWAVLLFWLAVTLVYVVAGLGIVTAELISAEEWVDPLDAGAWIATAYLTGRLFFALPPIAVGRGFSLREAWRASAPQAHKLMLIAALISIPFEVLSAFAMDLGENALHAGAQGVLVGATLLGNTAFMLHIVVVASALTFCYAALGGIRIIMEARGLEPEPEAAPA